MSYDYPKENDSRTALQNTVMFRAMVFLLLYSVIGLLGQLSLQILGVFPSPFLPEWVLLGSAALSYAAGLVGVHYTMYVLLWDRPVQKAESDSSRR